MIDRSQLFDSSLWVQENDNTPLEHTPGNPPGQLWKESLYSLSVKVWGCVPKVCWNNLRLRCWFVKHWAWTLASIQARPGHRILCGGTGGWKGWAMGFFHPQKWRQGLYYTWKKMWCTANWVILYYQAHLLPETWWLTQPFRQRVATQAFPKMKGVFSPHWTRKSWSNLTVSYFSNGWRKPPTTWRINPGLLCVVSNRG